MIYHVLAKKTNLYSDKERVGHVVMCDWISTATHILICLLSGKLTRLWGQVRREKHLYMPIVHKLPTIRVDIVYL